MLATVAAGTVAHELSHAAALRAFGVPYELLWLPDRDGTDLFSAGLTGRWAAVRPRQVHRGLSPLGLRVAALMPLLLTAPVALVLFGVLPDPFQTGNAYLSAAVVGWLACALPSPQDFSLFWYPDRAIERFARSRGTPNDPQ
jgi:hypothetical protein